METLIALIVQLVAGGVGGNVLGRVVKATDMGTTTNTVAGAVGGLAGTWLAGMIPGLDGLVGSMAAGGGVDAAALAGQAVTGVVGGGVLTAIAGVVKNNMMKS